MKEINRFSFAHSDSLERYIVFQDEEGFYHINRYLICDPEKRDPSTLDRIVTAFRDDIHSRMNENTYINWLTNVLFNRAFVAADSTERKWLMGE